MLTSTHNVSTAVTGCGPVVDTAQTWASFKQLVLPEESKPAQSPLIKVVEDLEDYMKHYSTLGWFGFLWEIQLFECSSGLGRVDHWNEIFALPLSE